MDHDPVDYDDFDDTCYNAGGGMFGLSAACCSQRVGIPGGDFLGASEAFGGSWAKDCAGIAQGVRFIPMHGAVGSLIDGDGLLGTWFGSR